MEVKPMKILIVEDDINDCNSFRECSKNRKDIEIVGYTASDVEALNLVKVKHPEGIALDLELNNSENGNTDSFEFIENIKKLKLNYEPIIIVTTHVNSNRTYEMLHKKGIDLILYKDHPGYSSNVVLNRFLNLRKDNSIKEAKTFEQIIKSEEELLSDCINHELDLIGITSNLKGRQYIHDAVLFLIQNEKSDENVIKYLSKIYKKGTSTITNGIENAIIHGWRVTPMEELEMNYTNKINYQTGIPTPMELIYYYVEKVKKIV